jgi:hypothetical protein
LYLVAHLKVASRSRPVNIMMAAALSRNRRELNKLGVSVQFDGSELN